jgi:arsenate reductase
MPPYTILFLCSGNSARSIMAEALVNFRGGGRYRGVSAGSTPRGEVQPLTFEVLADHQVPAEGLRSKGWDEFAAPGAPALDLVVTVCDRAAREPCPVWPGHPAMLHWSIADPAAATGSVEVRRQAFETAFRELDARVQQLMGSLDRLTPASPSR